MNNWNALTEYYAEREADLMAERSDEWALDPYEWENKGLLRMTPIEEALWSDMREEGVVMYPQYPVGGFFVDFGNPVAKVAIECDGAAYHLDKEKDAARDRALGELGWMVYRFTGRQCKEEFDEETMQSSHARQTLRHICTVHAISRRRRKSESGDAFDAAVAMLGRTAFTQLFKENGL
jgi:very-short-patch-repair endonuclease